MITDLTARNPLVTLAMLWALAWTGCGDTSSKSPTAIGGDPSGSSSPDNNTSAPTQNPPADSGPSDDSGSSVDSGTSTETDQPLGPRIFDLGVEVGTHPGMEGALFDVIDFPQNEILTVLAPDAIPAITDPVMLSPDRVNYLSGRDMVFGVVIDGDARAYPHNIGWWHEIVNDVVGGRPICVTFCPLTGTGLVYDGVDTNGDRLELGVSGLLYNTNLVMFNRSEPRSLYPQIFSTAMFGDRQGHTLDLLPVVETTWDTWKRMYPQTKVMAKGSYSLSRYSDYPYGDYRSNDGNFLFPLRPTLATNPNSQTLRHGTKDRVLGLRIDGDAIAFPFDQMGDRQIIHVTMGGLDVAVAWDAASRMAIPYSRQVAGQVLNFDVVEEGFPFSMRDQETGTLWDIRGLAVEGELAGERLAQLPAHNAMWFAWVTFWPNTEVWSP